ncbi:hypothetical protein [Arthrobacter sp. zg-Y1143]|uniref:hypothetical protein n=1 Tax=Arthrobacter sp. zg-Y1143 TaxID=3049065 RepID=UPI0024C326CC|nr:hypothetical protein [Arthrobacter sp. zg-Y1143]
MENYGPAAGTQGFQGAPPPPPGAGTAPQPGQQWPQLPPPPGGEGTLPQRQPNPKRRKRLIIAGSVAGGLLVLLGVGGYFGYQYMDDTVYSPRVQAEEYLQALVDGELEKALDMAPADSDLDNSLMTDEVYSKVENRISGFEITDVAVDGDKAEVSVDVEQGGESEAMKLSLSKAGTEAVLFKKWKVDAPLGTWSLRYMMDADVTGTAVNGVDFKAPEDGRKLAVMPGDYTFSAPNGTKFVSYGEDEVMNVGLDSQESLMGVGFLPEITDAARDEIKAQTRAHLDACMKSTELLPKGCPNKADGEDPNNFRNIKWSMTREPTYAVIEGDPTAPFSVTAENGQFTLEAEMKQGDDWGMQKGTVELYSMPAKVNIQGEAITMVFGE